MATTNLIGMPTVLSPTVIGREDRAEFMRAQADRYGINIRLSPVKDFYTHRQYKIFGKFIGESNFELKNLQSFNYCTFVSYLECAKNWYNTTDEEYVIVCDDDTDFSTSEDWNFTWEEFFNLLPKKWQCVQLIRMRKNLAIHEDPDWKLKQENEINDIANGVEGVHTLQYKLINRSIPTPNNGGGVFMFKREYVKRLIDQYTKGDEYHLDLVGLPPGIEGFPYPEMLAVSLGGGATYNIPLFVENIDLNSTYINCDTGGESWVKVHINSNVFYRNFWKEFSNRVTIRQLMFNRNINYT